MKILYELYLKLFPNNYKTSMTEYLMKQNRKNLIGAELGVRYGGNAMSFLKHLDIQKMYLIDHYSKYVENGQSLDYGYAYPIAVHKLRKYKDNIVFIRKDVNDAIADIVDSVDFVYIDVTGEYNTVYNLLCNYYPLVKPGGIIGGKRFNSNWFDLCRGILKFTDENDFDLIGCNSGDWWIVKK